MLGHEAIRVLQNSSMSLLPNIASEPDVASAKHRKRVILPSTVA